MSAPNKRAPVLADIVAKGADEALDRLSNIEINSLLQAMFMRLTNRDEERLLLNVMKRLEGPIWGEKPATPPTEGEETP